MKVEFLTRLRLEPYRNGRRRRWFWPRRREWIVTEEFRVQAGDRIIVIPKGRVTDLASVPRMPLTFLIAGDVAREGPVVHDELYGKREDRAYADEVFYWCLVEEKVPEWICKAMWAAVRVLGWREYMRKPRKLVVEVV